MQRIELEENMALWYGLMAVVDENIIRGSSTQIISTLIACHDTKDLHKILPLGKKLLHQVVGISTSHRPRGRVPLGLRRSSKSRFTVAHSCGGDHQPKTRPPIFFHDSKDLHKDMLITNLRSHQVVEGTHHYWRAS